jgi:3-oxoacyl-[acyl-carrier protein] reductase
MFIYATYVCYLLSGIGSSVAYAASKGALVTMTLSLARALGPIKVNAVCPGFIQGEWLQEGLGQDKYHRLKSKIEQSNPLRKTSTAEDIAQAIYFFAAQQQIITGETLILDGGAHLAMSPLSRR